jgi:hypothetical protein
MLGLLLALWSVLLTGEPLWLHSCPTMPAAAGAEQRHATAATSHAATAAEATSHAPSAHAHHTAMSGHAHETSPSDLHADETPHHSDSAPHECNCVGVCASTGAIAAPLIAIVRVPAPAEVVAATTQYPQRTSVDARPAPSTRLPWPTAPPAFA